MTFRAYADNVLLALEPLPSESKGGIALVHGARKARDHRTALVIAAGPGHYKTRRVPASGALQGHTEEQGAFIATQVKPGERVVIDAAAGEDYAFDVTAPRHNVPLEFQELIGERGEFRVVREAQILGVLE